MELERTDQSDSPDWRNLIPWYTEWRGCLYDIGTVTVECAQVGLIWRVRVRRGTGGCIGRAEDADALEAFRLAGGRALEWRLEESARRRTAHERGRAHEERLRILIESVISTRKYPWITAVRLATPEEDRRGVDVVVTTDVGDVGLQVKSSFYKLREFEATPGHEGIRCIVVNEKRKSGEIKFFAVGALAEVRHERLRAARARPGGRKDRAPP